MKNIIILMALFLFSCKSKNLKMFDYYADKHDSLNAIPNKTDSMYNLMYSYTDSMKRYADLYYAETQYRQRAAWWK